MLDTARIKDFRVLHFTTGHDVIREAERIVAAERSGSLRRAGNWTPGQIFGHLATWIEFALDGYPPSLRPPWIIKFIMKLGRNRFFSKPFPRGYKIPGLPDGTLGTEPMSTAAGLQRLRRAWERLMNTPPTVPNPIFGPLTHDQWIRINLGHAELHMGYLHP